MLRTLWLASIVFVPAHPGMIPFGPPLKPAKKCGSMKPVTIRRSASTTRRLSVAGVPSFISPTVTDVVLTIVVDDFVVSDDLGGEHVFELSPTVGTMRAGLVDENDPITRMVTEGFKQPRDDAFVGIGARVVRKRDHHTIGLTKTLPEWRVTDGMRKRMKKGSFLIGERDAFSWFDDRSLMVGALDLVQATTKGERDAHGFSQFRGINSPMQKAFATFYRSSPGA